MKYLQTEEVQGAECSNDAAKPSQLLDGRLAELKAELAGGVKGRERAKALLDSCYILLDLKDHGEAARLAHEAFDIAIREESWLQAVEACDVMVQAESDDMLQALAHGIWLGVTFPIDPELTVAMLQHLVELTPDNSDGGALAAAAACYVTDLRAEGKQRDELKFFTNQLIGQVARRHSNVQEQDIFEFWIQRNELDDPSKFLPRLAKVLDVLVEEGSWWFDRDALRERILEEA